MNENAPKVAFVAVRFVDVTYFNSAYPPAFYRPITGIPEEPKCTTAASPNSKGT